MILGYSTKSPVVSFEIRFQLTAVSQQQGLVHSSSVEVDLAWGFL